MSRQFTLYNEQNDTFHFKKKGTIMSSSTLETTQTSSGNTTSHVCQNRSNGGSCGGNGGCGNHQHHHHHDHQHSCQHHHPDHSTLTETTQLLIGDSIDIALRSVGFNPTPTTNGPLIDPDQTVTLTVNDELVTITNPDPNMVLVDLFRENLKLTGPKKPCGEGGCGACTVVMLNPHYSTVDRTNSDFPPQKFLSFNSCLRRVVQCQGEKFYTAEYFAESYKNNTDMINIKDENIPETIA